MHQKAKAPVHATRRARRTLIARVPNKSRSRRVKGDVHLDAVWRDVHFAIRGFRRQPAAALGVVATLALALGLNATAFSVFNAYVFRPAAVRDADSLHRFSWSDRTPQSHRFTWREYEELRRDTTGAFSEVLAERLQPARFNDQPLLGLLVTGNYFSMLGVPAALGARVDAGRCGGSRARAGRRPQPRDVEAHLCRRSGHRR